MEPPISACGIVLSVASGELSVAAGREELSVAAGKGELSVAAGRKSLASLPESLALSSVFI